MCDNTPTDIKVSVKIIIDSYGLHFTIYICKENDFYIKTEVVTMNLHFTGNSCVFTSVWNAILAFPVIAETSVKPCLPIAPSNFIPDVHK